MRSPKAVVGPAGAAAAAAFLLLPAAPALAQAAAARPADAMAFVRVVADLRIVPRRDGVGTPVVKRNAEVASGSGFVIAPSGLVLTSRHVVEIDLEHAGEEGGQVTVDAQRIEVVVGSGGSVGSWEAQVVASDQASDLAALQLTAADLPYLPLGDSDAIEAGRGVKVLGFPFGRQTEVARRSGADVIPQVSVSAGSLSATREDDAGATRFLQTDASVQPGNSGGPMLDDEGYVVGVVRMKLARGATSAGAGFAVPVNEVKDFLEANGLADRLAVARLRPGVRHLLEWKQVAVDLPDGFSDRSPARVLADAGEVGEIHFRVDRWETPWPVSGLEEALLGGEAVRNFVPAAVRPLVRSAPDRAAALSLPAGRTPSLVGSGTGVDRSGRSFRVEYAIVDLGPEKVVARYLGPPDALAFNLGLLRRSLRSLEAAPLLSPRARGTTAASRELAFERAAFPNGDGAFVVPRGWAAEPVAHAACDAIPQADAGLLTRDPLDFTVVLRALRFRNAAAAEPATTRCGRQGAGEGAAGSYALRFDRLGVPVAVRGTLAKREGDTLLLELEAPLAKLAGLEDLYARFCREAK
jgi:S1-C subfamily serine protease